MNKKFAWLCLFIMVIATASWGQTNCFWQEGDPHKMHFPQLPDTLGWDVNATNPVVLADDWQCSETGWIKDFHWWGSWRNGVRGNILNFIISVYSDIPADPPGVPYSRPGQLLWQREIPGFDGIAMTHESFEGWYDPASGEVLVNDHQEYFFYNLCLDQADWFAQTQGVIYWLSITAIVEDPTNTIWGWKSSVDHFNDDAVWAFFGEENWIEMYEPGSASAGPRTNDFFIDVDPNGFIVNGGGTDFFGEGWYEYPSGWFNIWFYDHPFDPERYKESHIEFDVFPLDPGQPAFVEIAVNWSTDAWSLDQLPSDSAPPLPGQDEALYIGRQTLLAEQNFQGHYTFDFTFPDYNPEWVSIDVRGFNFSIPGGFIVHDCMGEPVSLDLAFVVTGGPDESTGACCFQDGSCSVLTINGCLAAGGTYQGDGTSCLGDINPANGIDDACETGPFGACCFSDGSCLEMSQVDCMNFGGTYQGNGTVCQGDNNNNGIDDACEPPPEGACCFDDGSCAVMTENDCLVMNGIWKGAGTNCLGDNNNNGIDDACESWTPGDDHKMHYPQLPDTLGWDVNASWPVVLADDWQCSETGWVKDIHFWGSWLDGEPGNIIRFTLSIHEDIPAGADGSYSRPGKLLWEFPVTNFNATPLTHESFEGYYDPLGQIVLEDNHQDYFQYDVYLEEDKWFWQEEGTIYWLNITAHIENPTSPGRWGWKSSVNHFNDDATWGLTNTDPCVDPDDGTGTVALPADCPLSLPNEPMVIIDGLPQETTIEVRASFDSFFDIEYFDGGDLGGQIARFKAIARLPMEGTGALSGFTRSMQSTADFELHIPSQSPGSDQQEVPVEILSMNLSGGGIFGDPDFDFLQIQGGSNNGLPSPGHVTLTRLPSGNWNVDSFFDIEYKIEFQGAPGSILEGMGGATQAGPIRMTQGGADVDAWFELYEPPDFTESLDLAFVITGDPTGGCDCVPGDANNDGVFNLLDILYLIDYVYGSPSGPPPIPYRLCSGDVNCDCIINLLDILYLISSIYDTPPGPAPCSCDTWLTNCGGPLRK